MFRYSSEYFDKETGTIYLRARYYNPRIGRFISEDSVWGKDNDPLSLNLYTYCGGDPVNFFDPTGHAQAAPDGTSGLSDGFDGSDSDLANKLLQVISSIHDFFTGVGAGVLESISYGESDKLDIYYDRDNNTIYLVGKVTGDTLTGIISGISTIASGTFTVATSPTGVGAIAGSAATIYCGTVTLSAAGNAASNVMQIVNGDNSQGGSNSNIPVKDATTASNGLNYQSNPKHTLGQPGNRPNAGIEPKNSLDLFGESTPSTLKPNQRYTFDKETNTLHRFFEDGNGTWHWSGSTNQGANSITGSQVPNDIKNLFNLPKKGW